MPAFNAAAFIGESIRSVQEQDWSNWELIVADDDSKDETKAVVDAAAVADPRIRYVPVPPPNGSAARARNAAMAESAGDFIAFLDSDDLWDSRKLSLQMRHLRRHPETDAVVCWYALFGDREFIDRDSRIQPDSSTCTIEEVIRGKAPALSSTLLMRRRCYETIGGEDEDLRLKNCGEDFEYFARLVSRFRIDRITQPLTFYRMHAPGQSNMGRAQAEIEQRRWNVFEVIAEKKIFTPHEEARRKAYLLYETARDRLFVSDEPFLDPLLKCLRTGHAPVKAWLLALTLPLPRSFAVRLLTRGQQSIRATIRAQRDEVKS